MGVRDVRSVVTHGLLAPACASLLCFCSYDFDRFARSTAIVDGSPSADGASPSGGAGGTASLEDGSPGSGAGGTAPLADGGSSLVVFRNGTFATGWSTDGSWNTCNGTPSTAPVAGSTALAIDLSCNSFNGVYVADWNHAIAAGKYSTLSFQIYFAAAADIANLQIYLQEAQVDAGLTGAVNVRPALTSTQANAFNAVTMPLSSFGAGKSYLGMAFFNNSNGGIPPFYVNEIVLTP
jgi:hypothetical protein